MRAYTHTKLKKPLAVIVIMAQLLLGALLPLETAFAAAVYPGTPQNQTETDFVCFTATQVGVSTPNPYCYPTPAACQLGYNAAGGYALSECLDMKANQGGMIATLKGWAADFGGFLLDKGGDLLGVPVAYLSEWVSAGAGMFLASMAVVLDQAIDTTVNSNTYGNLAAVNIGWTAVRDVSNMFFIFVLLYIAIMTVLGIAGGSAKRMVANLIIAALLINFSLFATQVVIDAGNILALGFWNKITTKQDGKIVKSASSQFMQGFRIQTVKSTDNLKDPAGKKLDLGPWQRALINFGGAVVMLVAGYVFLAGAIMMIIRTITLLIVMIASPFAFLSFALPKGGGYAGKWFSKLMGASFVAPAFIFMLYIDTIILTTTDIANLSSAGTSKFGLALSGSADNFAIIYNFIVITILMLATLTVANSVGNGVGSSAGGYAKKAIGFGTAAVAGGAAWGGRQAGGRIGKMTAENEKLQEMAKSDNALVRWRAKANLAVGNAMKKGTWDVRNVPGTKSALGLGGINAGAGSKQTYEKGGGGLGIIGGYRGTENEKAIIEKAKEYYPDNPIAQQKYLESKLGKQYKADRLKDTRETVAKGVSKEENKAQLKKANTDYASTSQKLKELEGKRDELRSRGEEIGTTLADEITKISAEVEKAELGVRQSMQRLTGDDVAKLMDKAEYRNSTLIQENLSSKDYSAINKRYLEGGYKGAEWTDDEKSKGSDAGMMASLTENALRSKTTPENVKKSIKESMKKGLWGHDINFQKNIAEIVASGKNPDGSYIPKASPLSDDDKKALNDYYSMLDHDDIASFHESLHYNPHLVEKFGPKTLAAINKKQYELGGETNTEYVKNVRDAVARSNNQKAKNYINANRTKDTIFKGQEEIVGTNPSEESARWRELFNKGASRTPAEEAEMNKLSNRATT